MSCNRLRRELIDLFRFGDLDWRSAPHLDHLVDCRACRDEVGLDRALVRILRETLAERVAGAAPPSAAWSAILARAQAPEGGFRGWLADHAKVLAARLRTATTGAAMTLAILIAASTEVGIHHPEVRQLPANDPAAEAFELGPARPVATPRDEPEPEAAGATAPTRRPLAGPELTVRGERLYVESAAAVEKPAREGPEFYFRVLPTPPARADAALADEAPADVGADVTPEPGTDEPPQPVRRVRQAR